MKDIKITKGLELKKKSSVEFKTIDNIYVQLENMSKDDYGEINKLEENKFEEGNVNVSDIKENFTNDKNIQKSNSNNKFKEKKQSSESSNFSKNNDSIGSVIPVITISTTESDDEILQGAKNQKNVKDNHKENESKPIELKKCEKRQRGNLKRNKNCSDLKSLQRQSSVDSINEKNPKERKCEETGHKYQYSL